MGHFSIGIGLAAAAITASMAGAQAQGLQSCARGDDIRVIEVRTPGEVGAACDLRYVRDGGANVSVPYRADNDAGYCAERARALAASLVASGYVCGEADAAQREAALGVDDLAGGPSQAETVADSALEPAVTAVLEVAAPATATTALLEQPAPAITAPAQQVIENAAVEAPTESVVAAIDPVDESSSQSAVRGPVALAPTQTSAIQAAPPRAADTRKVTGASAEAERLPAIATAATQAAPPPATTTPVTTTATASVAATAATPPAAARPVAAARPAPELIRAVLTAQAAAWNDGDLEAFMNGYWKNPSLRFVSGTAVTKGWAQTLARYRERYGVGAQLGRLSFDGLDVQMLTDEVAIVVGRFALARAGGLDSGAFTLVMQRFDGVWRIVHDHTAADAAAPTQ